MRPNLIKNFVREIFTNSCNLNVDLCVNSLDSDDPNVAPLPLPLRGKFKPLRIEPLQPIMRPRQLCVQDYQRYFKGSLDHRFIITETLSYDGDQDLGISSHQGPASAT
ncbi:hypothetical protein KR222_004418 [Zaprionus bogoriensis]|nr:hypothetical protein KR222_004418 [Zaprionus bogoriensis]